MKKDASAENKQQCRRRFPGDSENSCVRRRVEQQDYVWLYDFLSERTPDVSRLKLLAVIDEFTRECLATEGTRSFTTCGRGRFVLCQQYTKAPSQ